MKDKTKKWLQAAGIRALKSFAEGCLAVIGTNQMFIHEINWLAVLSGGSLAAALSILLALKGLPEVNSSEE